MSGRMMRCSACDGTGYDLVMGEETCWKCCGTGRDFNSDVWSEPCRNCNGRGKTTYCRRDPRYPCHVCHGAKVVSY